MSVAAQPPEYCLKQRSAGSSNTSQGCHPLYLAARKQVQHWDDRGNLVDKHNIVLPPSPAQAAAVLGLTVLECLVQQPAREPVIAPAPPGDPRDIYGDQDAAHVRAQRREAIAHGAREPAAAHSHRERPIQGLLEAAVPVVVRRVDVHLHN